MYDNVLFFSLKQGSCLHIELKILSDCCLFIVKILLLLGFYSFNECFWHGIAILNFFSNRIFHRRFCVIDLFFFSCFDKDRPCFL